MVTHIREYERSWATPDNTSPPPHPPRISAPPAARPLNRTLSHRPLVPSATRCEWRATRLTLRSVCVSVRPPSSALPPCPSLSRPHPATTTSIIPTRRHTHMPDHLTRYLFCCPIITLVQDFEAAANTAQPSASACLSLFPTIPLPLPCLSPFPTIPFSLRVLVPLLPQRAPSPPLLCPALLSLPLSSLSPCICSSLSPPALHQLQMCWLSLCLPTCLPLFLWLASAVAIEPATTTATVASTATVHGDGDGCDLPSVSFFLSFFQYKHPRFPLVLANTRHVCLIRLRPI